MATTVQLAVSSTVVYGTQRIQCTATVSTTPGASAVQVVNVTPYALNAAGQPAGASLGACPAAAIGKANTNSPSATAAGVLVYNFDAALFDAPAPLNPPYPSTPAYNLVTLGVLVGLSDGTTPSSSTTIFVYPLTQDTSLVTSSVPGNGALRFDANTESALVGAFTSL